MPVNSAAREGRVAALHRRIRACTKCVDGGFIPHAFPIVDGTASDRIMIIGQAPGAVELTTGLPFSGRAGAELRRWLARAGIDEEHLPYRTAITKCFPGKAANGEGDRRPSPAEIALCAPWLEQELALVRPRIMLLVGTLAIERFWGRGALQDIVGRSRREGDRVLIPLPHPSGTSRWLNDPANRLLLGRALGILRRERRELEGTIPLTAGGPNGATGKTSRTRRTRRERTASTGRGMGGSARPPPASLPEALPEN